jgi:hypothetical protein
VNADEEYAPAGFVPVAAHLLMIEHNEALCVAIEGLRGELRDLRSENQVLREVMPCTRCNSIGVVPEEAFGRDEDGAPMVDGVQPCPEGCELPGWLIAERNDARDDAAELDRLREQLAEDVEADQGISAPVYRIASRPAGTTSCFAPVDVGRVYTDAPAAYAALDKIVELHDSLVRCFPLTYARREYRIEQAEPAWGAA